MKYRYGGYIEKLSDQFQNALSEIEAEHNFELGEKFEKAICNVLSSALPERFGICRGFAVSVDGETAGDDVIIYDRGRHPTLRPRSKGEFEVKERIPIEAVYAYIEAKHTLYLEGEGNSSIAHAFNQVATVKALVNKRQEMGWGYQVAKAYYAGFLVNQIDVELVLVLPGLEQLDLAFEAGQGEKTGQ